MNSGLVFDQAPRRVYWEVTRACDLACRHCRAQASPQPGPGELSTAEGLALLDRLAAAAPPPQVVLTGGDPLKRRDLFVLIGRARVRGLRVSVAPSATPLLTLEMVTAVKNAEVDAISLSVDGPDAARHDALRGQPGCFDRTITAARAAASVWLPFQINTLVCEETLDDLPAIRSLTVGLGAARWSLFFLVAVGRGALLRPITSEACEQLLQRLADAAVAGPPVISTTEAPHFRRVALQRRRRESSEPRGQHDSTPRSGAGIRDGNGIMFISHVGDVYPSGFLPLSAGNVRTDDPMRIYRESVVFRSLRNADLLGGRCGACEYRWLCGGSRARAFAGAGDFLAEDPLCAYEPRRGADRPGTGGR